MSHKIPFLDLRAQHQAYKSEIDAAMARVIENTNFIMGEEVAELEKKLQTYTGSPHAITCANGTDALQLALMALDLGPGDEIITTPFSFMATVETAVLLGIKPIFVDIDPETYNLNTKLLADKITPKTKAIIPVSLYGQPSNMDEINQIATRFGITVIEDAAQSFGATYKGVKSCNLSTLACTSFFPSKPLGCYGDGGALFTNNAEIAEKLRSLRIHGQKGRYHHIYIGVNSRLDTLQAAVLIVKLKHLDDELIRRNRLADTYNKAIKSAGLEILPPIVKSDRTTAWAQYTIQVSNRDKVVKVLQENGIPTSVHYPEPLYGQPALKEWRQDPRDFPVTEEISKRVMSLPFGPFMSEGQVEAVVNALKRALS